MKAVAGEPFGMGVEDCDHDLDAEFLYPSDATVLEVYEEAGEVRFSVALPCPTCDTALQVEATAEEVEVADFELPLDDSWYD